MLKTMHLVGALALGLTGFGAAQSASAQVAPSAPTRPAPAQTGGAPLNLGSSLTQQLARAALLLHAQAPLWGSSEPVGTPPQATSRAAPVAAPASVSAPATATPVRPLPSKAVSSSPAPTDLAALPQLPDSALIRQAVLAATAPAPAPAPAKAVAAVAAPVQPQSAQRPAAPQRAAPQQADPQQAVQAKAAQLKAAQLQAAQKKAAQVKAAQLKAAQTRAAQVKAAQAQARASQSPVAPRRAAVASGISRVVRATAYSSDVGQTDSTPFITATGTRVRPGVIALSRDLLRVFPYGSRVTLRDSAGLLSGRVFIVEDTMNVRLANTIDIWMGSRAQAYQWGARTVTISAVR